MKQPLQWTDAWHGPDEFPEHQGMYLTTLQGEYGTYVQANWFNRETKEWTYRPYGAPLTDPLIAWTSMPLAAIKEPAVQNPSVVALDIEDVIHETGSKLR